MTFAVTTITNDIFVFTLSNLTVGCVTNPVITRFVVTTIGAQLRLCSHLKQCLSQIVCHLSILIRREAM